MSRLCIHGDDEAQGPHRASATGGSAARPAGGTSVERTGTPFNDLQYPTDIVLLAVLWRLGYKLGFRDVAELLLQRGFEVTHETIRAWEVRFAPLLADPWGGKARS